MPKRPAVSANDTPYSLISFNAIALLSFGKGGRRLPVCIFCQQRPGITHGIFLPISPFVGVLNFTQISSNFSFVVTGK